MFIIANNFVFMATTCYQFTLHILHLVAIVSESEGINEPIIIIALKCFYDIKYFKKFL